MAHNNETHEHDSETASMMIENGFELPEYLTEEEKEELYSADYYNRITIMMPEMLNETPELF